MSRWTERAAIARAALLCAIVTGSGGACGDNVSGRLAGESAHFRLFVGNGAEAQRVFGGDTDGVLPHDLRGTHATLAVESIEAAPFSGVRPS